MPSFVYKALSKEGNTTEGTIEAANKVEAVMRLEAQGFVPIKLIEKQKHKEIEDSGGGELPIPFLRKRIPFSQLEEFTRSLASLLGAGVPLSRALALLANETTHPAARAKWKELHDLVIDGVSLADAMAQFPQVFPRVYVAMVEAGETGGFLELVLNQIADFQSRQRELRSRVIAALVYPSVLLVLAIGVLIFLLTFFIPRFQTMFEGLQAQLPWITQLIVNISHSVRSYGFYFLIIIVVGIVLLQRWLQSEEGRRRWESILLKIPLIGGLIAKLALTRFFRMLGTLLSSGVPLVQALNVARRSLGYQILIDAVYDSVERVRRGESLATSLSDCKELFRGSVIEMIRVAEESGKLDQELVRLANVYENDLDRTLKLAVSLAEPIMLFFIAGFIGTIFIGMVLPIFTIQDYIR